MSRVPLTIAWMRLPGTPIACASWFWLMPISSRNSSLRISPGCGLRRRAIAMSSAVIVHDLDVFGVAIGPPEADAPLVVDPDAHLSGTVSGQSFEAIARRIAQIVGRRRRIELAKLAQG